MNRFWAYVSIFLIWCGMLFAVSLNLDDPGFLGSLLSGAPWSSITPPPDWNSRTNWFVDGANGSDTNSIADAITPFTNAGYRTGQSYRTSTNALAHAASGDCIEFSGGTTGVSYSPFNQNLTKRLIVRGSRLSNHNARVTFLANSNVNVIANQANGNSIFDNFDIDCAYMATGLWTRYGIIFKNVRIKNVAPGAYAMHLYPSGNTNVSWFVNDVIEPMTGFFQQTNNINNAAGTIYGNAGANDISYFINCDFISLGRSTFNSALGKCYHLNSTYMSCRGQPLTIATGTNIAWNCNFACDPFNPASPSYYPNLTMVSGCTTNSIHKFKSIRPNVGFWCFCVDDSSNYSYATNVASIAKANGCSMTYYLNGAYTLTNAQYAALQQMYLDGSSIANHTKHHIAMTNLMGMGIKYLGAGEDTQSVIAPDGTTFEIIGTDPVPATNISHLTIQQLYNYVSNTAPTKYQGKAMVDNVGSSLLCDAWELKGGTNTLTPNTWVYHAWDDDTSSSNRFYCDEIVSNANDITAIIRAGPGACSNYTCNILGWPGNITASNVWIWTTNYLYSGMVGQRNNYSFGTPTYASEFGNMVWLGSNNVHNCYYATALPTDSGFGADYPSLGMAGKEARIREMARSIVNVSSFGLIFGIVSHTTAQFSVGQTNEVNWFFNELGKHQGQNGFWATNMLDAISWIRTGTDCGNGFFTHDLTGGTNDFTPLTGSGLIGNGLQITNRTTDITGKPVGTRPDIGAYQH